jgi:general stress protein 26
LNKDASNNTQVAALKEKIDNQRFAMFTTTNADGHLLSHPMTKQQIDDEGGLWFYTSTHADLWDNIGAMPEVNISFSQPDDSLYVSISGTAQRVVDRAKIKELWNPMVQAWFPAGPDDPHVVLVRVAPHGADSKMVRFFAMAKAAVTGSTPDMDNQHGKIDL